MCVLQNKKFKLTSRVASTTSSARVIHWGRDAICIQVRMIIWQQVYGLTQELKGPSTSVLKCFRRAFKAASSKPPSPICHNVQISFKCCLTPCIYFRSRSTFCSEVTSILDMYKRQSANIQNPQGKPSTREIILYPLSTVLSRYFIIIRTIRCFTDSNEK